MTISPWGHNHLPSLPKVLNKKDPHSMNMLIASIGPYRSSGQVLMENLFLIEPHYMNISCGGIDTVCAFWFFSCCEFHPEVIIIRSYQGFSPNQTH